MRKTTFILLFVTLAFTTTAFKCGGSSTPPPVGFFVRTTITQFGPGGIPVTVRHPNVATGGQHEVDRPDRGVVQGSITFFNINSGSSGQFHVDNGRAPAGWTFGEFSGPCSDQAIRLTVLQGDTIVLDCDTTRIRFGLPFSSTPSSINTYSPPSTVTVYGDGISSAYGMPMVEYYDETGTLVAQSQAYTVAGDGTSLTGYTPDLSSVPDGTYTIVVSNYNADGSLLSIGNTPMDIYTPNIEPPPDPDPCGPTYGPQSNMPRPVCGPGTY